MIWDTFMANDELDLLECRLTELESVPNLTHVVVEADVDHQDHPKPLHITEGLDRFAKWADRLVVIQAKGLPSVTDDPDPWAREHAQREFVHQALEHADPDDIVLHGDLDEIPNPLVLRNLRCRGTQVWGFEQRLYCFAVDWFHPGGWNGTVATRYANVTRFGDLRDIRNFPPKIPNAGWHLSWLGGQAQTLKKLGSFCHPEIADRTLERLEADEFLTEGWHVDGTKLVPVDVDRTWPRWIAERKCPDNWFRPR